MEAVRTDGWDLDDAIAASSAAFVVGLKSGDAQAAASVYAEDARLLAPSAELLQGREAIEAFWRAGVDAGVVDVEQETLELELHDGFAYEIGTYALRLEPAGAAIVVDRGRYVLVHERQADGSWRRAVEMFNPDGPPA